MSAKRFRPPTAPKVERVVREQLSYQLTETQMRGLQREAARAMQALSNVQQFLSELASIVDAAVPEPPKPER